MNVSLPKNFLLAFLLLLSIPLLGQRDTVIYTFQEKPVSFYFSHYKALTIGLGTVQEPEHGDLIGPQTTSGEDMYMYIYYPEDDFVGRDSFKFTRMNCFSPRVCLEEWTVVVEVIPTRVIAEQDIAFTTVNSDPINIAVLENDFSTTGVLNLLTIPMVNNGEANINPDERTVSFQPATGFEGIASFNYTVCDEYGVCDISTVSIIVSDIDPDGHDTLQIFTNINEEIPILTPPAYTILKEPKNGFLDESQAIPFYIPNEDYIGSDIITFQYGEELKRSVKITVLDIKRNIFLNDDKANVIPGQFAEIDVAANDTYTYEACLGGFSQPKYGTIEVHPDLPGIVTYHAPMGFTGIDEFTYSAKEPGCKGERESASVKVYVSNYEPAKTKFRMSTPKLTPLVIGYNVPISDFKFIIKEKAKKGNVIFLEGQSDTIIYGKRILGYNLILYIPDNDVVEDVDEFELAYCLNSDASGCQYRKDIKVRIDILDIGTGNEPLCFDDCIWAGDTNFDGIVNLEDLLPIGLYMGEIGEARSNVDLKQWYGQYGEDWQKDLMVNLDVKHIDTDGDSYITALDTIAINKFYGRTHSMVTAKVPTLDYEIILKGKGVVKPGEMIELEMHLGEPNHPAVDLYGFTFDLPYNTQFFDGRQTSLTFEPNSWITYNSPTLNMQRNIAREGVLEAAFTRTNAMAVSGFGKVAIARFVVVDDISGIKDSDGKLEIDISSDLVATATNGAGDAFGVKVKPFTITIDLTDDDDAVEADPFAPVKKDVTVDLDPENLKLFPNPSSDLLNFYLNGNQFIQRIQLFDLTGVLVKDSGPMETRSASLDIHELPNGVFVARVQSPTGVITKKVEVLK